MLRITNVRLPSPHINEGSEGKWALLLDENRVVCSLHPMELFNEESCEDWGGDWLSPMGVDLQFNGGYGLDFTELNFDSLPRLFDLLDQLWMDGVEAICPTFVSCDSGSLRIGLKALSDARRHHRANRCRLLGAHLEGPFLAKSRHGAHSIDFLLEPSLFALEERIKGFEGEIALFTLAPELANASEIIEKLNNLGVVVCMGHSNADTEVSRNAFEKGVRMITHIFNAMPGIHHRSPGPIVEAIKNGQIYMGLIADGMHVHPDVAVLLQRIAANQLVLVSDALSPYGLKEGKYIWNEKLVFVKENLCRLENETLAGTTLPLLEGVKRLVEWKGDPSASIWSATIAPRLVLNSQFQTKHYFIGQSLGKLLRWRMNYEKEVLYWQRAA